MKFKTEAEHANFGEVCGTQYGDGEIILRQHTDRICLTPQQALELVEILQKIVNKEK